MFVIAGVTRSVGGRDLAWKFVCDNWSLLHDRYRGIFLLARLVKVRRAWNCTVHGAHVVHETMHQIGQLVYLSPSMCKNYLFKL